MNSLQSSGSGAYLNAVSFFLPSFYRIVTSNGNIAVIVIFSSASIISCFFVALFDCFYHFIHESVLAVPYFFVLRFLIAPLSFCIVHSSVYVFFVLLCVYVLNCPFDCVHACLCGHLTMIRGLRVCWADALPTRVFGSPS